MATAVDDGTAGEMVASGNYWEAMSNSTSQRSSVDLFEQSASKRETGDEITGRKQGTRGDSDDGGGGGDGCGIAAGRTPAAPDRVEWAVIHLESGNVKLKASATAAEASYLLACSHDKTRSKFTGDR